MYQFAELPIHRHVWNKQTSMHLENSKFLVLGFQTNRNNFNIANASTFDFCNILNIKLFLNPQYHPYGNLDSKQRIREKNCTEPLKNSNEFQDSDPLIIIDCSRQNDALKNGPVDVRLEFKSRTNFPIETSAYCLMSYDRMVNYKSMSKNVRKIMWIFFETRSVMFKTS